MCDALQLYTFVISDIRGFLGIEQDVLRNSLLATYCIIICTFVFVRLEVIMYVQVRMMDTGVSVTIPTSRTTVLGEFKKLVEEKFNIKPKNQRLFFAGKQVRILLRSL